MTNERTFQLMYSCTTTLSLGEWYETSSKALAYVFLFIRDRVPVPAPLFTDKDGYQILYNSEVISQDG